MSSSSPPPPRFFLPPRRLLHCDHLRRLICKMFNGTFRMSHLFCRLPLGALCCDAAQSRIVSTTIILEMGNACFLRISCWSIPTNTVSKLSAKSLGGNSLMARKVGACSMMVVTPSSPHAERDRSHVGREKHLCENYPAQRQHQSAKTGRPPAFFAQIDEGACSLPVHTPSVSRRRRKHLGFVTCWQLNNWTRLGPLQMAPLAELQHTDSGLEANDLVYPDFSPLTGQVFAYLLTFFLAYLPTYFLTLFLASRLTFFLTFLLAFFLAHILAFFLTFCSGISSDILSDISCEVLSGILCDILSGISPDSLFHISSAIPSDITCMSPDII